MKRIDHRIRRIKMLLLDVDGVMTDGSIILGPKKMELKQFNSQDGVGIGLAKRAGLKVGIITGRRSEAVSRRAKELRIDFIRQGIRCKEEIYPVILKQYGLKDEEVAFVGDDIVDISLMKKVGLAISVANGVEEVKQIAHYVTGRRGGEGAIREVVDLLLTAMGKKQTVLDLVLAPCHHRQTGDSVPPGSRRVRGRVAGLMKGVLLFFLAGAVLSGAPAVGSEEKPGLAVLPFFAHTLPDSRRGTVCPVCEKSHRGGELPPGATDTVTRLVQQKMEAREEFIVQPLEKGAHLLSPSDRKALEEKPVPSSLALGKGWEVDYVLAVFLFRYEERIGSSLGAEKPASVGLDLHLLRVRDGRMVWSATFDETQRPLSDDLLRIGAFLRRKASWLRAEELASVGLDEILRTLPAPGELEEVR